MHCHSVHDYPTLPPEAAYKWPLKRGGQGVGRAEWPGCWLWHSLTALSRSLFSHLFAASRGREREQHEQEQSMTSSLKGKLRLWWWRVNFPWMPEQNPGVKRFALPYHFNNSTVKHQHLNLLYLSNVNYCSCETIHPSVWLEHTAAKASGCYSKEMQWRIEKRLWKTVCTYNTDILQKAFSLITDKV